MALTRAAAPCASEQLKETFTALKKGSCDAAAAAAVVVVNICPEAAAKPLLKLKLSRVFTKFGHSYFTKSEAFTRLDRGGLRVQSPKLLLK